jgi:hypothetical protein
LSGGFCGSACFSFLGQTNSPKLTIVSFNAVYRRPI